MRRTTIWLVLCWLALTGCGADAGSTGAGAPPAGSWAVPGAAEASPSPSADPALALRTMVDALAAVPYNFEYHPGVADDSRTVVGVTDPVARQTRMFFHVGPVDARPRAGLMALRIGDELWLRGSGISGLPTQWMSLQLSRIKDHQRWLLDSFTDPTRVLATLRAATSVQRSSPGVFRGEVDVTAVPGGSAGTAADWTAAGPAAKAATFTVTLADDGWIDQVDIQLADRRFTLSIASPGASPNLAPPARSETIAAPALLYTVLADA